MLAKFLKAPPERLIVLVILACGALLRLIWVAREQNLLPSRSESHNIGVALARTGAFADPFGASTGPTAHVGMLTPLPSALAYWLFGVDTGAGEFALFVWATALVLLGFWLGWRLTCELGVPRIARLGAAAFAAIVPLQFKLEVREGRNWEVNLAVLMLLLILLRLVIADKKGSGTTAGLLVTGGWAGLLFIISPPAGLATVMAIGFFQYLRLRPRQWWPAPLAFIVVAGLLSGIWAERNSAQLGAPIALRDNFGLELAASNYDGAGRSNDTIAEYISRLKEIHPYHSATALKAMREAGGEVAYYHRLGEGASRWILAHPAAFAQLSAQRFSQFYLPPMWFWNVYGRVGTMDRLQHSLSWVVALMGACSLIVLAWSRRGYAYLLIATLTCSAPYVLIQPTLRYRYLVSTLLIFAAFAGAGRLATYFTARKATARAAAGDSAP